MESMQKKKPPQAPLVYGMAWFHRSASLTWRSAGRVSCSVLAIFPTGVP